MKRTRTRLLAISSGGGHWVQLLRLRPAFADCEVVYASVRPESAAEVGGARYYTIPDATRWSRLRLAWQAVSVLWLLLRLRPDAVLTTGAAPGYFALRFGRLFGARTVWLDSIANVGELSLAGQRARPYADLWLTQWAQLAGDDGPRYAGAVI